MDEQAVMYEFRVTFGQRYRQEMHERVAVLHPDGFMVVRASSEDMAYRIIHTYLGRQFTEVYAVGPAMDVRKFASNGDEIDWYETYPKGELFRAVEGVSVTK